ncbi:Gfo/Idh/MocA family protein [Pseudoprimorskyibacter insulae]|uniref:Glucose--fructose oxidoreductase n=1 Tax=Pseudoprimorskyibacter insulae TaxID=1695997 RepID=A0A2R8AYE7_9RHOB|nr:Gfo/Idh/MocA family oxidoreductase [Pseudoprimorskyibacter insulae]SPF81030.1 Glucose--fructose oxidoreductase [Pseudoprimorskyibacter insulae]
MRNHVNWGVLGAAKFAKEHMAPAIHAARRGRLAGLATSSADKAAPFAAMTPDLTVYDSYDAMLADPAIDAVYVPLPNHLHVEWALKAMDAGKHVLVEKPLTLRADQFDEVIAKRDATGLIAAEAFMIVHHPQWHKARELYQSGAIGKLRRVSAAFSYDNRQDTGNIRNRPDTGGGSLPDIGVYVFGSTRFVTGEEPTRILSTEIEYENGVDVWAHVTAEFPSFHYSGVTSMRMTPWQDMTFHGDKGLMRLTAPFNANVYDIAQVELHLPNAERQFYRFPMASHYVNQVEAFNASVLDGADYPCPLEFVRGTQTMIDMVMDFEKAK